jgi:hypothetical protein
MMKRYMLVLGLLVILGGWGCSMVTSGQPIGDTPVVLDHVTEEDVDRRNASCLCGWRIPGRGTETCLGKGDREMALKTGRRDAPQDPGHGISRT